VTGAGLSVGSLDQKEGTHRMDPVLVAERSFFGSSCPRISAMMVACDQINTLPAAPNRVNHQFQQAESGLMIEQLARGHKPLLESIERHSLRRKAALRQESLDTSNSTTSVTSCKANCEFTSFTSGASTASGDCNSAGEGLDELSLHSTADRTVTGRSSGWINISNHSTHRNDPKLGERKRKVRFSCNTPEAYHSVLSRGDFTQEEATSYWYSERTFHQCKKDISKICQQARHAENGRVAQHVDSCFAQVLLLSQVMLTHSIADCEFDSYIQQQKLRTESSIDSAGSVTGTSASVDSSTDGSSSNPMDLSSDEKMQLDCQPERVLWDYDDARSLLKDFRKWTRKSGDRRGLEKYIFAKKHQYRPEQREQHMMMRECESSISCGLSLAADEIPETSNSVSAPGTTTDTASLKKSTTSRSHRDIVAKEVRSLILTFVRQAQLKEDTRATAAVASSPCSLPGPSNDCSSLHLARFCYQHTCKFALYARFLGLADAVMGAHSERDAILASVGRLNGS
jgi:hypothetical protein